MYLKTKDQTHLTKRYQLSTFSLVSSWTIRGVVQYYLWVWWKLLYAHFVCTSCAPPSRSATGCVGGGGSGLTSLTTTYYYSSKFYPKGWHSKSKGSPGKVLPLHCYLLLQLCHHWHGLPCNEVWGKRPVHTHLGRERSWKNRQDKNDVTYVIFKYIVGVQ